MTNQRRDRLPLKPSLHDFVSLRAECREEKKTEGENFLLRRIGMYAGYVLWARLNRGQPGNVDHFINSSA